MEGSCVPASTCPPGVRPPRRTRLLPHIHEEYDFRITNRLLIEKITNPRRDRTIVDSLSHTNKPELRHKQSLLAAEKTVSYRRKMVGHRLLRQDSFVQTEPIKQIHRQRMQEEISEVSEMAESTVVETRESSLRDNFVGRIIKNQPVFHQISVSSRSQCVFNQTARQPYYCRRAVPSRRDQENHPPDE
jgi:hypothetical protein